MYLFTKQSCSVVVRLCVLLQSCLQFLLKVLNFSLYDKSFLNLDKKQFRLTFLEVAVSRLLGNMEVNKSLLGAVDYVIFASMLLISAGIGVYFRFSGGKQKTTDEYLLAGRNMSVLPVAISLMASFLSAITTIGMPAEMYRFGIHLVYMNVGYLIGMVLAGLLTLPVYFELQASSAYEYLDRRFGKYARTFTSAAFVVQMILYMSVVLYAPALALSAVTSMPVWGSIVSIGVVCTFYCTLGGMKAVLWTDVFQGILMFLGIFAVIIIGLMDMGISTVYDRAYEGGRLAFPSLDFDLTVRYTIWGILFQGAVFSMISYGGSQIQIQRLLTVKDLSRAKWALYLSVPLACFFHVLTCSAGIIIYAYYADCDPLTAPGSPLSSADQLLPYYMMSALGRFPGLPGLCICGVFSASLSTVSSAINSLTAVTMQDFIRPFLEWKGRSLDKMVFGAKVLTLFYGSLGVALSFIVAAFGNLIQVGLTVYGMLGAPILAILILGMMTTRTNQMGAVVGLLAGVAISAWICFGASSKGPPKHWLPVSVEGCAAAPNSTLNEILGTTLSTLVRRPESLFLNSTFEIVEEENIFVLYRISYMWFSSIGLFSAMIIAYITSLLVNFIRGHTEYIPEELLSPMAKCFRKEKKVEQETKAENAMELKKRQEPPAFNGVQYVKEHSSNGDLDLAERFQNSVPKLQKHDVPVVTELSRNGVPDVKEQNGFSNITQNERL